MFLLISHILKRTEYNPFTNADIDRIMPLRNRSKICIKEYHIISIPEPLHLPTKTPYDFSYLFTQQSEPNADIRMRSVAVLVMLLLSLCISRVTLTYLSLSSGIQMDPRSSPLPSCSGVGIIQNVCACTCC